MLANGEVREVDVTECLESRSLAKEGWEVAKHNLQDLGFEELGQQIAKPTSVIHPRKMLTALTASWMNTRQAKNAGAIKDREGLPSARIANVI